MSAKEIRIWCMHCNRIMGHEVKRYAPHLFRVRCNGCAKETRRTRL